MNIQNEKKDSDLSSNSSWTFINDSKCNSRKNSFERISTEIPGDNVTKEMLEQNSENAEKKVNNLDVGDTSFLNFDEYSLERFSECGTFKPKVKKSKKTRKNSRKCHGDSSMSLLTIVGCLLTIAGITLLTTLLPPSYAESTEQENLKTKLADVYESSSNPTDEDAVDSLHATMEAIESARSMDILNRLSRNLSGEEVCQIPTDYQNESCSAENQPDFRIRIFSPYAKEIYSGEKKPYDAVNIKDTVENKTKTFAEMAKDLVRSPSLQIFVATLIQDFCLIKLINEFSKATRLQSDVEIKENETVAKKEITKLKKMSSTTKKSKKTSKNDKNDKVLKNKNSPKLVVADLLDKHDIRNVDSEDKNETKGQVNENGKSECERRFEELDTRGATLGFNHWQKIQEIKNKFQKKIFQIKEKEKENYNRSQKVRFTREKFLQRLKSDREVYLLRLRKIREERKQLLDDVCHGLNSNNLVSKDASVGNFAVLIPKSYNFNEKIKVVNDNKNVESKVKLTAFNSETVSYVPINSEIDGNAEKNKNNYTAKEKNITTDKYCELKRKYLRKKAKLLPKRKTEKDTLDIQEVVTNMINGLTEFPPQTEPKVAQETSLQEAVLLETPHADFQIVNKKKTKKRHLNKLYQAAFEKQSEKIKEDDAKKWKRNNFDELSWQYQGLMTKQDPSKSHKAKIINKGVL